MPSDQELICDLNKVASKLDKSPTYDEYDEHGEHSPRTVEKHFGTWNKGKEAAGIEKIVKMGVSNDELLTDINRVAGIVGTAPTIDEYKNHGDFAWRTQAERFGCWNDAVVTAGYTPYKFYDISDEELLADLDRVADIVGSAPSERDYNELGKYHYRTFIERFESWSNAHRAIDLEPNKVPTLPPEHPISSRATNQELLDNLRNLADKNKKGPSVSDLEGKHSSSTYNRRFGGIWAANVRAGLTPSCPRPLPTKAFHDYHMTAVELSPEEAVTALLPAFTGMTPSIIAEFSEDWREKRSDKRIITVPKELTESNLSWIFRIPEVWTNPDTNEEIETQLPSLLDWYWEFYDKVHLGKNMIRKTIKKTARKAGMEEYRQEIEHSALGSVPDVSAEDLAFTQGVILARRGVDAEDIARRLGIEYRGLRFSLRNIFVWCEERHHHSHHDWNSQGTV